MSSDISFPSQIASVLIFGVALGMTLPEALPAEATRLETAKTLSRSLGAGEKQSFLIAIEAESYLYLMVEQLGIDLELSITAPDGVLLEKVDGPGGPRAYEVLTLVTHQKGEHRVQVEGPPEGEGGAYKIWIDVLRDRRPDDEARVEAERVFTEGLHFEAQGDGASRRRAAEKFAQTILYWRRLHDLFFAKGGQGGFSGLLNLVPSEGPS